MKITLATILGILILTGAAGAKVLTVGECKATAEALVTTVSPLAYPKDWTFYVSCSPATWTAIQQKYGMQREDFAFTDRAKHVTILNGDMFKQTRIAPTFVMRHELGHFVCETQNENTADLYAKTGGCF
jgi:hypothetical protein